MRFHKWHIKQLLFLGLAAFFLFSCKKEQPQIEEEEQEQEDTTQQTLQFSMLCYNVAGLPQVLSSSDPERFMTSISPLLNDYNIVQVQEDFCYHDSLLLFNQHPYKTDPMPCVPDGDGLNTFSDYAIANLDRVAWTDCTGSDCLTPKGFYYSQITFESDLVIDFYNVHCNAGSDAAALAARRNNIAQLSAYIAQNSEGRPVFLFGDFNCRYTRSGDSIRTILDLGFKDAWLEYNRNGEIPPMNGNSLRNCDPDRNHPDCEVVDKIFYRSNDEVKIELLSNQTDDSEFYYNSIDSLPLSDHWPLKAAFELVY